MSYLQSILLGILQGIAEFLPISSSGHLAIFQDFLGIKDAPIIYDILLHIASLLVIIIYFRKIIVRLVVVLCRYIRRFFSVIFTKGRYKIADSDKKDGYMIIAVLLGTVVTFSGYLFLEKVLKIDTAVLKENLILVYSLFIFTGILLIIQSFFHPQAGKAVTPWQGMLIGFGQILGLFPGVSRSGSTISTAIMCGVDRKRAGEISFLLSIPAILGSLIFMLDDLGEIFSSQSDIGISTPVMLIGMLASFASGMVSFPLLLKILQKEKLYLFSIYLIPLGVGGLIFKLFF